MKIKTTTTKQNITPDNPYFNDIKGYYDVRSADKINVSMWRIFGLIGLAIGVIGVSGMIYIGSQAKFVPMIFYTDAQGGMQYGGVVTNRLKITQPMLANQLADYIVALRQVPLDVELKSQYMRKVKMMTKEALFNNGLIPVFTERYNSYLGKTLKINVRNTIPISKDTWEITWDEVSNNILIGTFKGMITFTINSTITDTAILLYDPLGIVVNDININQEINHQG